MPENYKLCQCNICSAFNAIDSETNETIPGVFLSRPVWVRHQASYKKWLKSSNTTANNVDNDVGELFPLDGAAEAILSATVNRAREGDPILSRRSEDFPNTPQEPDPGGGGITDTAVQEESAGKLISLLFLPSFISLVVDPPDLDARDEVKQAAHELEVLETQFRKRRDEFRLPELHFDVESVSSSAEMPQLPYNSNKHFLNHQNWILKLIDKADALAHIDAIKERRKAFILEVQAYENSLDDTIRRTWENKKYELGMKSHDPQMPDTVNCCECICMFMLGFDAFSVHFYLSFFPFKLRRSEGHARSLARMSSNRACPSSAAGLIQTWISVPSRRNANCCGRILYCIRESLWGERHYP